MLEVIDVVVGPIKTNCWVVCDPESQSCLVIDPGDRPERILEAVGQRKVEAIVLTHGHDDHRGALADVVAATGAPVMAHELDAPWVYTPVRRGYASPAAVVSMTEAVNAGKQVDRLLHEGDEVALGAHVFRVIHTPGHSKGSMCLYCASEGLLFTGDTVFADGSYGRTDFEGGSWSDMVSTLDTKFADIPSETVVYPGHGATSTLGAERMANPFLK